MKTHTTSTVNKSVFFKSVLLHSVLNYSGLGGGENRDFSLTTYMMYTLLFWFNMSTYLMGINSLKFENAPNGFCSKN